MVDNIYISNNGPETPNSPGNVYDPPNVGANEVNYSYVLREGSTMTGPLLLDGDPIYQEQATPKSYVDNAVSNIAFKVESFYRTSALLFDGNTVLVANTISCVDTSYYTFSAWYYQFDGIANGSTRSIFSSSNDAGGVGLGDPYAGWFVYAGGANGVVFTENNGEFQGNVASWHHVLVATDLTVPTFQIYVDGARINADITQEGDPTTSPTDFNGNPVYIGGDGGPSGFFGLLAEVWFDTTTNFITNNGTVSSASIAKFRDPNRGIPVNLGNDGSYPTGNTPAIYLRCENCDENTFINNLGSGGTVTVYEGSISGASRNGPASFP